VTWKLASYCTSVCLALLRALTSATENGLFSSRDSRLGCLTLSIFQYVRAPYTPGLMLEESFEVTSNLTMRRSKLTLMDLPDETLEVIFHEALSPEKYLTGRQFDKLNVKGWSRLNRRLSPIALSSLLRHCGVVVGLDEDLLLEWLLAPDSAAYFPLVKELKLQIRWFSKDVLSRQRTLTSIARIPSHPLQTVHLRIDFRHKVNFSRDDSAQLSSIVADWNVTKLEVLNYGADAVLPQLASVSHVSLYYVPLNSVPNSFYTNIESLKLTECSMDTAAEMRIRNASVEKLEWRPVRQGDGRFSSVEFLPTKLRELIVDLLDMDGRQQIAIFRKLGQLRCLRVVNLHYFQLAPFEWEEALAALPNSLTSLTLRPFLRSELDLNSVLARFHDPSYLPILKRLHISGAEEEDQKFLQSTLAPSLREALNERGVHVAVDWTPWCVVIRLGSRF
jgi:hypothetical protein